MYDTMRRGRDDEDQGTISPVFVVVGYAQSLPTLSRRAAHRRRDALFLCPRCRERRASKRDEKIRWELETFKGECIVSVEFVSGQGTET